MTRDLCIFTEPRTPQRMFGAGIQLGLQADACNRGAAVEADAIREQQPKWTRSGAAAGSGHKRGAAVEADAIGPGSSS